MTRITPFILLWLLCLSTPVYPSDVLIASGHVEYPPFMYRQGDKIIGVGPDLTTMIFNELGITVDSKYVGSWNRVQRKAEAGEIDLIVGIYKTDVREKYLSYPDEPYVEEPVGI
ncbi:MAG: transporter substrate-binding domain-containing protein, partial [Psychrosphaera sp.]|nr:transporter substrate-binding domain-containing protein [Psychrosphaera sp.]